MIKIYGMSTCTDCTYVKEQVRDNHNYEIIDIGAHVRNLKAFLKLRDHEAVFDEAKKMGAAGIPSFVLENGKVTLTPEEADLKSLPIEDGATCSLDGKFSYSFRPFRMPNHLPTVMNFVAYGRGFRCVRL